MPVELDNAFRNFKKLNVMLSQNLELEIPKRFCVTLKKKSSFLGPAKG